MKHLLATLVLALGLAVSSSGGIPVFSTTDAFRSIVRLTFPGENGQTDVCTGFVIDAAKGWAITARHCTPDGADLAADEIPSHVVKSNELFSIVEVPPMSKPPLEVRSTKLNYTEPVIAYGYGYGNMQVFKRNVASFSDGDVGLDGPLAPGMSGGPVIDSGGKVVGLIQATSNALGIVCGQDEIRKFIK